MTRGRSHALSAVLAILLGALAPSDESLAVEIRFNCGGDAYVAGDGRAFDADQAWTAQNGAGHTAGWAFELITRFGGTDDEP